ncbi:MAG: alpha/beta hydrolase [Clostridia bacterium]|nr:alpha/beta hydrolase [Clostridia bacterium]
MENTRECLGADIHYIRQGNGDKKILLLHGWGCSQLHMQPLANALQDAQTLILEFPAHGKSGRPPEPWGVPEYARAAEELIRAENFFPCSVIAHSFGARVAIFLASSKPELFDRLILTGAAGLKKPPTEESQKRTRAFQRGRKFWECAEKIRILGPLPGIMQEKLRKKYGSADYNALDEEMRKTFVKIISLDLRENLKDIKAPTLLVWGSADTETPLWMGQTMEKEIPDAGLAVLEGGTHFAYLEQLQQFVLIARNFFGL